MKLHLIIFSFSAWLMACIPVKKSAEEYIILAEHYFSYGKSRKAYKACLKAISLNKENPTYYLRAAQSFQFGWNMSKLHNQRKVLELYNSGLNISPWNEDIILSRARFFESVAGYKSAFRDLDSLLSKNRNLTEAYLTKANIYIALKDTTSGFNVYRQALNNIQHDDHFKIYSSLGISYYYLKCYRQSINNFLKDLQIRRDTFPSNCFLSASYCNIGMKDSSCYYYKKCGAKKNYSIVKCCEISPN